MEDAGEGRERKSEKQEQKVDRQQRANMILSIAHPARRRILRAIIDRGQPCSPIQLAQQPGLPVSMVAYHAKVLCKLGALELIDGEPSKGATEQLYDSTIEDDPPIETLLEETREVDAEGE